MFSKGTISFLSTLCFSLGLTACQSGGGDDDDDDLRAAAAMAASTPASSAPTPSTPTAPQTRTVGVASQNSGDGTVSYDPATGFIRLNGELVSNSFDRVVIAGNPTYSVNRGSFRNDFVTVRGSRNGVYAHAAYNGRFHFGGLYGRLEESELPTSGSAQFAGDYRAMMIAPAEFVWDHMQGDMALDVDFASGELSGAITNRRIGRGQDMSANDLLLRKATLDANGMFVGETSGGELAVRSGTTNTGTYEGIIGGANGNTVGGLVTVQHTYESNGKRLPFREFGAFIAESR